MQQVHDDAELVTVGETLALMSNAQPGLLRHQRRLDLGIGGSESNVAIGARRLGTSSAWIGRVGDDEFGHLVVRELLAETVHVHATTDPERPTALMVKERRTSDTARVFYYRSGSAGANLAVTDLDRDLIRVARRSCTSRASRSPCPTARARRSTSPSGGRENPAPPCRSTSTTGPACGIRTSSRRRCGHCCREPTSSSAPSTSSNISSAPEHPLRNWRKSRRPARVRSSSNAGRPAHRRAATAASSSPPLLRCRRSTPSARATRSSRVGCPSGSGTNPSSSECAPP